MKNLSWNLLVICFVALTASCAITGSNGQSFQRQRLDDFYTSAGVMQYFLPEIPPWVRTSVRGQCFQETTVHHLRLDDVMASFSYDYDQAIHLQYNFNISFRQRLSETGTMSLAVRDFERLFFDVSDQIQSDITVFQVPRFHRVHVVWVDPFMNQSVQVSELTRLMRSEKMDLGHPVFISLCHQREKLEEFVAQMRFEQNIRLLSYEALSPYNSKSEQEYYRFLEIDTLMGEREVHLFLPRNFDRPIEIRGDVSEQRF